MNKKTGTRKGTIIRLIKLLFEFYPVMLPLVLVCILLNALISSIPAIFQQNIISIVEQTWQTRDWASVSGQVLGLVKLLAFFYVLSLIAGFTYTRTMAVITQGSLMKLRKKMFDIWK